MKLIYKLSLLKKNGDFKNVFYSVLSYCITPLVLIVSTPVLLKNLGDENYGIWILINSVINLLGISNFGLGNALIKIGSEYEPTDENNDVFNELLNVSLTLSVIVAILLNIIILLFGMYLFPVVFGSSGMETILPLTYFLGGVVGLRIINGIISGSYMARQRYDINSKVNIVYNLVMSITFTILTMIYKDIHVLVLYLFLSSIFLIILNAIIAKKVTPSIEYKFLLKRTTVFRIINYGIYSWFQSIVSSLNAQADKLIVSALLGPKALGYYTVCMQLVIKIHEIPAAAGGFLLAKFSGLYERNDMQKIRGLYAKALKITALFIIISSIFTFIFAYQILSLWITTEFANQHTALFRLLVVSISLGAFGVIPYYFLNGTGHVRINTVLSLITSLSTTGILFLFIPYFGDIGTGMARFVGIPLVLFSLCYVHFMIIKQKQQIEGFKKELNY
ncbi:oligosaccharide flippase family protein [Paenibacillus alkalitolerans]|uniref:oligosaccharide flippase family protein n=1 Tax=Paenibacillus alkalitolerans TaxID=2799335 RepID=UPI0018F60C61|nr:oligosaccharide flippase family protein [Paenibacillus alkalitolerans]